MAEETGRDFIEAAARMAAEGQYKAATALLDRIEDDSLAVEALLLRARISAQQDRYDEAIVQWQEALALDPENEEARKGIATAERYKQKGGMASYARRRLVAGGLLAALVLLACVVSFSLGRITSRRGAAGAEETPAWAARLDSLGRTLDRTQEQSQKAAQGLLDQLAAFQQQQEQIRSERLAETQARKEGAARLESALDSLAGLVEKQSQELGQQLVRQAAELTKRFDAQAAEFGGRLDAQAQTQALQLEQIKANEGAVNGIGLQLEETAELLAAAQSESREALETRLEELRGALDAEFEETSEQFSEALAQSRHDTAKDLDQLRTTVAEAIQLSRDMRELAEACRKYGGKLLGPNRAERKRVLDKLEALESQVQELLAAQNKPG